MWICASGVHISRTSQCGHKSDPDTPNERGESRYQHGGARRLQWKSSVLPAYPEPRSRGNLTVGLMSAMIANPTPEIPNSMLAMARRRYFWSSPIRRIILVHPGILWNENILPRCTRPFPPRAHCVLTTLRPDALRRMRVACDQQCLPVSVLWTAGSTFGAAAGFSRSNDIS